MALSLSVCSCTGTEPPTPVGTEATPPPTGPIADLVERTSMTKEAERLFLAAHPKIEGRTGLRANCRQTSSAHALGCFLLIRRCARGAGPSTCSRQTQIHLLDLRRPDLRNLRYVAAAHEVLHAAYEELGAPERKKLNRELHATLPRLDRCRVSMKLAAYSGRVGKERSSELHSILGTELAPLSARLETHYSRYFRNRRLVVDANDRALGRREQEICGLEARLDRLEARLGALEKQLRRLRSSGNVRAYNARVSAFSGQVGLQRRLADTHRHRVRDYNRLLARLGSSANVVEQREGTQPPPS